MPRRKLSDRNIRKIIKTGKKGSFSITLPIEVVRELKWREKQKVVVNRRGKKIVIEDWQKK